MSDENITTSANEKDTATYRAIQRLAIPESIMPVKDIPELLVENRNVCMGLAKLFMQPMAALSQYFGIPLMEVIFDSIPEEAEQENLAADGIREAAAAKAYWDFKGAVPLADLCKGMYASKVPALKLASAEMVERGSIQKMCNAESPFPKAEREDELREQEAAEGTTPQEDAPSSEEGAHGTSEGVNEDPEVEP